MTKNRTMRASILVLALALITSCFVGGTLAKYISDGEASDTARVAKWGVTITTTVDGDNNPTSSFASTYMGSTDDSITVVQASNGTDALVAPGTNSTEAGSDLIIKIAGTPEVRTQIDVNFTATQDIYYGDYHPVKFTLWAYDTNSAITAEPAADDWVEYASGSLADIEKFINEDSGMNSFTGDVNECLDAWYKITWEWEYETEELVEDTANGDYTINYNNEDTKLGDLMAANAAGPDTNGTTDDNIDWSIALAYEVTVTITQVD